MKKVLIFFSVLFLCLTIFQIGNSFGLFETNVSNESNLNIAKWHIYVNDSDITGKSNVFNVDDITYTNNDGVSDDKFAPGVSGSFILVIDPKDTQTSFTYDFAVNFSSYKQIKIDEIVGINDTSLTFKNDRYYGVMSLKDIQSGKKDYIKITFSWDADVSDEADSLIGNSIDTLEIPISIKFEQYK